MGFVSFVSSYIDVIAFYAIVAAIIYVNRKKFDFHAKFIAMYRTKIGIPLMHWMGDKATGFIKWLGIIGIWVGYAGMLLVVFTILEGMYNLIFVPEAPATFAPVIPGVKIPGSPVFVPFWYGIISLFVVVVIHEFSHGVVAAAHKLRVKNTGFVMFGPLPGAFVEPDEKELTKAKPKVQLSIYAAGPFSNVLLAALIILLFGFLPLFAGVMGGGSEGLDKFTAGTSIINFGKIRPTMYNYSGVNVTSVFPGAPASLAGLPNNTLITSINGQGLDNVTLFEEEIALFANHSPGDVIVFASDESEYAITIGENPDNASQPYIGIMYGRQFDKNPDALEKYGVVGFTALEILFNQLLWIVLLSLGIGLANLLPLGPVDGGRMYLVALERFFPKKKAQVIWSKTAAVVLTVILILVFVPIIKAILF